jgi:diguanylate cyclase (GGDEF)-like protein
MHVRSFDPWAKSAIGKVLIVEPDPDIARMLEVRLARDGHDVVVVDHGQAALRAAKNETLDVALVDGKVADILPIDLLQQLKSTYAPFEVILMSVDPTTEMLVKALEAGAYDLVVKPFTNLKILTTKLKSAVVKVRAERDRDELARMLAAQTQDMVHREAESERTSNATMVGTAPPTSEDSVIDLDGMTGVDTLTGLPNRRASDERFKKETARALRYDRPLCVALGSVDGLDRVIDGFGAAVADGVLRGIASMFSGMVRDVDFCARRQGGEFLFIFPETAKESGFIVVDRIRLALSQTSFSELGPESHGDFQLSASFGLAALPTDTMNADLLRDAAEAALVQAKITGDRVVAFDGAMLKKRRI